MKPTRRSFLGIAAATVVYGMEDAPLYRSQKGWKPLLNGRDLSGWRLDLGADKVASGETEWSVTDGVLSNGRSTRTMNVATERKFGDFELYVEFLLVKGSNSGIYHHGLYEVQLFDSYGSTKPLTFSDGGGIYQRWENGKGFGGFPPRTNACRPAGEWQWMHTKFRAPRFDAAGKKIENARFDRVVYNGTLVQENVPVDGPTRSGMKIAEAAENPLMLQGDHGAVEFRKLYIRPL